LDVFTLLLCVTERMSEETKLASKTTLLSTTNVLLAWKRQQQ